VSLFFNALNSYWQAWSRFFFSPLDPLPLGVFRFVFGLNAFIMYSVRFLDWKFYYTDVGMVSSAWATEIVPEFFHPAFTWYPSTPLAAVVMHSGFLLSIAFLCVGFFGRWAALSAYILHLAFIQRNYSIIYGADLVNTFFFFSLALSDNDRAFSLRKWLGWVDQSSSQLSAKLSTVAVRLLQIQMCVIYAYTGLEKMKGKEWWDGTAVWAVVGNTQLMMFDSSWLKHFPLLIAGATFSTLIFEIYFPVLVWPKATRKWTLVFGVMLHTMIGLTVGLVFFSVAMISTYFVFLHADTLKKALIRIGFSPRWI
jgi:hypothetical protein